MVANRINLEILNLIPLEGVDTNILCSGCAAACCQKNVVMPLTADEALYLEERGAVLEEVNIAQRSFGSRVVDRFIALRKADDHKLMKLTEDCGNLGVNPETGRQICEAYYDDRRPQACSDFKMGSYACGLLQLRRLKKD